MKRICLLILLMGMITLSAFAANVTVNMNAVSKTMKLTDKATGVNVDVGTPSGTTYTFTAAAGDYVLTAYGTNGTTVNGTIGITVTDEAEQTFKVFTITAWATNSGWTLNTDYTIQASVSGKDGVARDIVVGNSVTAGRITIPMLDADTYICQFVPSAAKASAGYMTGTKTGTVSFNTNASMAIPMGLEYSITVPQEAELFLGTKSAHYKAFDQTMPESVTTQGNQKVYTFKLASAQNYNFRTWTADGMTYAGYFTANTDATKMPQLQFASSDYTSRIPGEVRRDNLAQTGDILLNINERGHLNMTTGDTYDVTGMRSWQATDNTTNNYYIEPRFRFKVLNEQGQPDNSVVTFDTYETNVNPWVSMRAVGTGTAIVLVTYDAINLTYYNNSATASNYINGPFFGAIWPENTGVYVVTVNGDAGGIVPNMTIHEDKDFAQRVAGKYVDAEHDVFYYPSTQSGATYTFSPTGVSNVTIASPTIDELGVSYSGFSTAGVTANADGSYTLLLKEGRNIVKLTDASGHSAYQVLTAKPVVLTVSNATTGNSNSFKPGDKVEVSFSTVYHPANKLAGIYNMSASLGYTEPALSGAANQYAFASTPGAQKVSFTIPTSSTENTFTLTGGYVKSSGFGDPYGNHRLVSRSVGRNPNFAAQSRTAYFGQLPDITVDVLILNIKATISTNVANPTVTLTCSDGSEITPNADGSFTLTYLDTYSYKVSADGYSTKMGTFEVTEADGNEKTVSVHLDKADASLWDGTSAVEPTLKNGVYQISTGAELAWFAQTVNAGTVNIKGLLLNDIDLAFHNWTPIASTNTSAKRFTGSFDGQGHTVRKLFVQSTSNGAGLFGYTSAATIKDLTVEGTVSTTGNYAGGVVAYITGSGTSITGCTNKATVSGKQYVGGVIGYGSSTATIDRCANLAAVSGSSTHVGGIVGQFNSASMVITNSYNQGSITGSDYVGGITGLMSSNGTITNVYNVGTITSGGTRTGSIRAMATSATATAKVTNAYAVESYANEVNTTIVTDAAMASGEVAMMLGSSFGQEIGVEPYPVLGGKKVYATDDGFTNISDYTLAVLTFEDSDYKGDTNFAGATNWSSLIDDPQYGGTLLYGDGFGYDSAESSYRWEDTNNTGLASILSEGYGTWSYWSGGHAISNYGSSDIESYGTFETQLTVYNSAATGLTRTGNGHNGSDNFAVHYGYSDNSGWGLGEESLPNFFFADGKPRTIDHMYVNSTNYTLNCFLEGNGLTAKIGDNDWAKIVATGYNGTQVTGTAELYLCNGPDDILMDWTKFELASLGNVTKVVFNILGSSDNGYGYSQPAYFAYDDVAVRMPALNVLIHQGTATVYAQEDLTPAHMQEIASKLQGKTFATLDLSATAIADGVRADDITPLLSGNAIALLPNGSTLQGRNLVADGFCSNLVLTDRKDFAPAAGFTAASATYAKASLDATGWYSCVLPYAFTLPQGVEAIGNATVEGNAISFEELSGTIPANTPFLYRLSEGGDIAFSATDVAVSTASQPASGALLGTYALIGAGDAEGKLILNHDGSAFATATETATIPAFRAYIEGGSGAGSRTYTIIIDGDITGLATVDPDNGGLLTQKVSVYSLDGKLLRAGVDSATALQGLGKGIYIINGKKISKQ